MIIDDYTNAGWPGVAEGIARYFLLSGRRTLAPFFVNWNKLLLTTESKHRELLDYFAGIARQNKAHVTMQNLYGFEVLHCQGFSENLFSAARS